MRAQGSMQRKNEHACTSRFEHHTREIYICEKQLEHCYTEKTARVIHLDSPNVIERVTAKQRGFTRNASCVLSSHNKPCRSLLSAHLIALLQTSSGIRGRFSGSTDRQTEKGDRTRGIPTKKSAKLHERPYEEASTHSPSQASYTQHMHMFMKKKYIYI